jgi:hypothetical protein
VVAKTKTLFIAYNNTSVLEQLQDHFFPPLHLQFCIGRPAATKNAGAVSKKANQI